MERPFHDQLDAVTAQIFSRSDDGVQPTCGDTAVPVRPLESDWHSQWNQGGHGRWYQQSGPNGSPVFPGDSSHSLSEKTKRVAARSNRWPNIRVRIWCVCN